MDLMRGVGMREHDYEKKNTPELLTGRNDSAIGAVPNKNAIMWQACAERG